MTDAPDPVPVRGDITYTVTVTNEGPGTATGVALTSAPPGSRVVSATGVTCTVSRGKSKEISCEAALGDLASGAGASVTIVVQAPSKPGTVSHTATVADGTIVFAPNGTFNANCLEHFRDGESQVQTTLYDCSVRLPDFPPEFINGIQVVRKSGNTLTNCVVHFPR